MRVLVDGWYTLEELAKIKGVKLVALRQWIRMYPNRVECQRIGKRVLVCRLSSLESYIPKGE